MTRRAIRYNMCFELGPKRIFDEVMDFFFKKNLLFFWLL
jgi:hypothetical protein